MAPACDMLLQHDHILPVQSGHAGGLHWEQHFTAWMVSMHLGGAHAWQIASCTFSGPAQIWESRTAAEVSDLSRSILDMGSWIHGHSTMPNDRHKTADLSSLLRVRQAHPHGAPQVANRALNRRSVQKHNIDDVSQEFRRREPSVSHDGHMASRRKHAVPTSWATG